MKPRWSDERATPGAAYTRNSPLTPNLDRRRVERQGLAHPYEDPRN